MDLPFKMNYYAVLAGVFASTASIFGKLSGDSKYEFSIISSLLCLIIMFVSNIFMWTYFSKSLARSNTSIGPTVTSSSVNYVLSGILGGLIFNESPSTLWWISMFLVIGGLLFISKGNKTILFREEKKD